MIKKVWGSSFEGEFEIFDTEEEAEAFRVNELGDPECEYGTIKEMFLVDSEELEAIEEAAFEAGRTVKEVVHGGYEKYDMLTSSEVFVACGSEVDFAWKDFNDYKKEQK